LIFEQKIKLSIYNFWMAGRQGSSLLVHLLIN
jgi:hypothetical protein